MLRITITDPLGRVYQVVRERLNTCLDWLEYYSNQYDDSARVRYDQKILSSGCYAEIIKESGVVHTAVIEEMDDENDRLPRERIRT